MVTALMHHGIKGMHWGVRRYQNYDGTRIGSAKKQIKDKWNNTTIGVDKTKPKTVQRQQARKKAGKAGYVASSIAFVTTQKILNKHGADPLSSLYGSAIVSIGTAQVVKTLSNKYYKERGININKY